MDDRVTLSSPLWGKHIESLEASPVIQVTKSIDLPDELFLDVLDGLDICCLYRIP